MKIRKLQLNREIAKRAADDIRAFKYDCIYDAVEVHFKVLTGGNGEKDRRKDFARYVIEDLRNGPKSLHVFQAMRRFTIKRREQPIIRRARHAQNMANLRGE